MNSKLQWSLARRGHTYLNKLKPFLCRVILECMTFSLSLIMKGSMDLSIFQKIDSLHIFLDSEV